MKNATRKYKSAMQKQMRNPSHCIVTIGNTDITAITDGKWGASHSSYSSFSELDYEHRYGDTVATLELNRWVLDGKTTLLTNGYNDGFVGETIMTPQTRPQILYKRFSIPHTFTGVTLTFDTRNNEFPFAVKVSYYNGYFLTSLETDSGVEFVDANDEEIEALFMSGQGSGLIGTKTVYPTSPVCEVELAGTNVDTITIEFISVLPYRRVRLEHIMWGVSAIFGDTQISKSTQSHDVDPLSRRLPQEKMDVTVFDYEHFYDPDNPKGIYQYITKGTPVSIVYGYELDDGTTEWLKADNYSLQNAPSFKNETVTFNCVGLLQTLNGNYYKGVVGRKSLYSIATDVLQDALDRGYIFLTAEGNVPWDIDTSLQSMYTEAVPPINTFANILQLVAHAARSRLYTDDSNIIHIKPFGVSPVGIFSGTFADNGHTSYSEWDTVDYGTDNIKSVATLELNRWVLDGSGIIGTQREGYVSNEISGNDGSTDAEWSKTFDVAHDLPIITLTFDNALNEHPFGIKIEYYSEDELINTEIAYPDDVVFSINSDNINNCTRIKVTALGLLPFRRFRVSKASFKETDFALTLDSLKEKTLLVSKIEQLRDVIVNEYHYESQTDSSELYKATLTLTEETVLHIEYQLATNISVSVTGGNPIEQHIYAQAADLKLSAGTHTITITGTTLSSYSVEHRKSINVSGDDDTETNLFITSTDMAEALADHIAIYLQLRNTYDATYRGNPELEVGDIIELETLYSKVVYGLMLTDQIDYNGALSGKVKVKGLI